MTVIRRLSRVIGLVAFALFASACDDDPTGPRQPGPPAQLTLLAGADQQAEVGAQLPVPISVKVADSAGVPLRGIAVEFAVASGGGSTGGAVVTDSAGLASTQWTLGTSTAQPQRLRVRVIHAVAQPEVTVSARASAGAASASARGSGDEQTGDLGVQLTNPLSVRVTDRFGNPVAGVPVAWIVTSGAGSVSTSVQPTDSAGLSTVRWTLGSRLDVVQRVTAQAPVGGAILFSATPRLPTSAQLTAVGGAPTSATVGREVPTPFEVLLRLPTGVPIEGATVTWSVVSGQATVSPATTRTADNGRATARLTLGNTPGQVVLAASVPGLPDVRFNVTANPDVPATVTIVSGNNQSAPVGSLLPQPLTVSVADRFGNALPGANVSWQVTAGGGTVTPGNSVTDAAGRASTSWRLGTTGGPQNVFASVTGTNGVTFTATAQAGSVATLTLTPTTLSLAPAATSQITATMRDQFGNLITDRNPTWFSSDEAVARVSSTGVVTGVADGTATITATIEGRQATATVTVVTPPTVPARPTNLAGTGSGSSVFLTWDLNSTNATRLTIEYRHAELTTWQQHPNLAGHVRSATITGLESNSNYVFRIAACNNLGCSPFSDSIVVMTAAPLALLTADNAALLGTRNAAASAAQPR